MDWTKPFLEGRSVFEPHINYLGYSCLIYDVENWVGLQFLFELLNIRNTVILSLKI